MPRIPSADPAGFINHTRSAMAVTGNNMRLHAAQDDTPDALKQLGRDLGGAFDSVSRGFMDYARELQNSEDMLAAAEGRSAFKRSAD